MIWAFAGVALVLYVGFGLFTLTLCRAAKNGDEMQAQVVGDDLDGVFVPPVRR